MGYQAADGIMMSWPRRKQSSPENLGVTHSTNGKDTQGVLLQLQKSISCLPSSIINSMEQVSILPRFGNETISEAFL